MFYNGFNLMIDIILVTATVFYMKRRANIDYAYWSAHELDHEYNEGYDAGYAYALRNKNNNQERK